MKALLLLAATLLLSGCGIWEGIGSGAVAGVQKELDSLNKQNKGLITTLFDQKTQDHLQHVLDSVLKATSDTLSIDLRTLETKVLPPLSGWIDATLHQVLGVRTKAELDRIIDSSVTPKLNLVLRSLNLDGSLAIQTWKASLLQGLPDDITKLRLSITGGLGKDLVSIRDSLLDSTLTKSLGHMVAGIMDTVTTKLHSEEQGVKKVATGVYWSVIGGIALLIGLSGYVYYLKHRYQRIADVLTSRIHEMPAVVKREDFLATVSSTARTVGIEKDLRRFLDKRGILGETKRATQPNSFNPLSGSPIAAGPDVAANAQTSSGFVAPPSENQPARTGK
jgi:hypothetical protein